MTGFDSLWVKGGGIPLYQEINAIMKIKCHIMGICTLRSEESCMVLSSNLMEVSVTFIISGMHIGLNWNGLSAEWRVW